MLATLSDVYVYEGVAWETYPEDYIETDAIYYQHPVYRFYNVKTGSHFYTMSEAEKTNVIAKYPSLYLYEGPALSAFSADASRFAQPVYRFYNKVNGSHFYTVSETEKDLVRIMYPAVYKFEGIAFCVNRRLR